MEVSGLPQVAIAGVILLVMVLCFGILSVILDHHWSHYEIDAKRRLRARRIYYTGAGIILIFMLIAFVFLLI